ncbi:MAG: D-aminoacyl-tRNA deacylase [Candidatus Altiarchaeota archaeon]|nr:D-aminoacyl-tRNA deacylase [Candidatus Altiarchaeota archaeon]
MSKRILFSEKDPAGRNIARILRGDFSHSPQGYKGEVLYMDADVTEQTSLYVVASRHKSMSKKPCLTAHSPGNYGNADAGGNPGELGIAPALYLREAVNSLERHEIGGYEVCLEVTHHGPTNLKSPVMFVEVGSTIREWSDPVACKAVAETISDLMKKKPGRFPAAIGFGGGHYCRKFTQIKDYAIGHICPKYNLHNLDKELIEQMMSKTKPAPEFALVEKKGMGREKKRILDILKETSLDVEMI